MKESIMSPSKGRSQMMIRGAIMGVIVMVSIGYLLMWVMMPTTTYLIHWSPQIQAHSNSTFFGTQGANILIYTFPILFISVLGSLYLHLGVNFGETHSQGRRNQNLASWKRTLIIRGLGIVSWIELAFLIMFFALLVWTFSNFMHFFAALPAFRGARVEKMWETNLERVALVLGIVGNVCLTFLFFPVTRLSPILPVLGLTSEGSIKYHIWLGHTTMALFTAHGLLYIAYWGATNQLSEMIKWGNSFVSNVAGEISLVCGLVLWVTTYPSIRRKMFELFFYTHYLYILFIIFFVFHLGFNYAYIMLPGFYIFTVDRYLRFLQSRHNVALVSARVLPCETIELNFSKTRGLSYTPTSIIFINVPTISKLQWHPFTITSSSKMDPDILSVLLKGEGTWTKKLYQILASSPSVERLDISVEGPYGPASTHFLRHDALVMVSGGSGISPFISIIRELTFAHSTLKQPVPKLLLISAFKNSSDLAMLDLLLPISNTNLSSFSIEIQIEVYVTRETGPLSESQSPPKTIWFEPRASDSQIAPILGRNSWLWLGAILSFSFIIFLLFMGILTRYYIYPIDHNTNMIYSHSSRSALYMLLICVSIVITCSAAVLWKKRNAVVAEGVESSGVNKSDRELESLPNHSLLQSTKIHYGQRPDLKRILMERKESSIGVLVCGPKQMRYDVANVCSSGLADNLHFESISFTW